MRSSATAGMARLVLTLNRTAVNRADGFMALSFDRLVVLELVVVMELASYSPNLAVMINSPILINPVRVNCCVQNNLQYIRNYICSLTT